MYFVSFCSSMLIIPDHVCECVVYLYVCMCVCVSCRLVVVVFVAVHHSVFVSSLHAAPYDRWNDMLPSLAATRNFWRIASRVVYSGSFR